MKSVNKITTVEKHKIPSDTQRLNDTISVSYFGSVEAELLKRLEKDLSESNAGNLARQDVRLIDLWHKADNEAEYLELLEAEAGEEVQEAKERAYDALWNLTRFLAERAENGELAEVASDMIDAKFISEVAQGGTIEEMAAEEMAEHWEADEVLLQSTAIAAETGVRDPEAAGIDAVVKVGDENRTLQVKKGDGGDVDCEADYLVRLNPETGNVGFKEI